MYRVCAPVSASHFRRSFATNFPYQGNRPLMVPLCTTPRRVWLKDRFDSSCVGVEPLVMDVKSPGHI
jgi:hypothetical protein